MNKIQENISVNQNYSYVQDYLSSQIKQPKNLADLKRNANFKRCQLELARENGDLEKASILAYEYEIIMRDINNYYNDIIFRIL